MYWKALLSLSSPNTFSWISLFRMMISTIIHNKGSSRQLSTLNSSMRNPIGFRFKQVLKQHHQCGCQVVITILSLHSNYTCGIASLDVDPLLLKAIYYESDNN